MTKPNRILDLLHENCTDYKNFGECAGCDEAHETLKVYLSEVIGPDEDATGMIMPPSGVVQVRPIQASARNQLRYELRRKLGL